MLDTERPVRPEPCASHADHAAPVAGEACSSFLSQGFGPDGDWEHSRFCAACGWASGDHWTDEDEVLSR